ncbi:Aminodeoxychorismate/anthranilate synthase component 2 [Rubripirellula lacrimiformis]|uniref:Aminodeoxychorismate/anthranilate synthase component 2 n=1 Tax=Rubripirellula lacrimiformis TaxID=1930273 RepID=A0A517N6Z9_9BACT|nr:aminodeoxychorismate/anthranilate synthase component II [Rubripirellula lacrimiformis]QDT02890.1 Aminodeoxychorismate/anthranilate synthase component 2 [Rubripirellula lacrimiformis]
MILLLDNYDSFVHNLARYFRRSGCPTQVIRSDQIDVARCRQLAPDAIVVSPGPRRPEDAGCSVKVIRELSAEIPILGVCLGHQSIAVAFGGVVDRCGPMHGIASLIDHDGQGIFADCPSPMRVGRYHSLAIDPSTIPAPLSVTATTADGVIMGIRHRDRPVFGMQFHPESVLSDHGAKMIDNFIAIVRSTQDHPQPSTAP